MERLDGTGIPTRHSVVIRGLPWRVVKAGLVVAERPAVEQWLVFGRLPLRLVGFWQLVVELRFLPC